LEHNSNNVSKDSYEKQYGASIRCLKDWLFVYFVGWQMRESRKGGWGEFPPMRRVNIRIRPVVEKTIHA
jgi:hypothetical protein